jgi:protein SCO1/2
MKNLRSVAWKGVIAAILVYAGILYFHENPIQSTNNPPVTQAETTPTEIVAPAVGGDFLLTDQDGNAFDSKSLRGKYALIFFGFTHCPDICPVALQKMDEAYKTLDDAKKTSINPVFISVDPARDTPAVLKEYSKAFTMPLTSLTGDKEATTAVEKLFKVYAVQQQTTAEKIDDYQVDHSAFIYLLDKEGKSLAVFPMSATAESIATRLKELP